MNFSTRNRDRAYLEFLYYLEMVWIFFSSNDCHLYISYFTFLHRVLPVTRTRLSVCGFLVTLTSLFSFLEMFLRFICLELLPALLKYPLLIKFYQPEIKNLFFKYGNFYFLPNSNKLNFKFEKKKSPPSLLGQENEINPDGNSKQTIFKEWRKCQ